MKENPFALHVITNQESLEPLKAILPKDGTKGFVIGEDWEVRFLYDMLGQYLSTGQHDGEVHDLNEQLGYRWLIVSEAVSLSEQVGCPANKRTVRWAAANGFIRHAEKFGRDWRFPQASFLYWLHNRPKPGRK